MRITLLALTLGATVASVHAGVIFSSTSQSTSRFNVGTANTVSLDDLYFHGAGSYNITKITVGIRRIAAAPSITVNFFVSDLNYDTYAVSNLQSLGGVDIAANGNTAVTQLVSIGNGVSKLGTVHLADAGGGWGLFSAGINFTGANATNTANGWRIVAAPASGTLTGEIGLSDDVFVEHNLSTNTDDLWNFGGTPANVPGSFYIVVEGEPVPEPASLAAIGIGCLALLRRKRK